jgi:hypothetical protein
MRTWKKDLQVSIYTNISDNSICTFIAILGIALHCCAMLHWLEKVPVERQLCLFCKKKKCTVRPGY